MDTSESRDDLLEDLSAIYLAAKFGDKESVKKLLKYLKWVLITRKGISIYSFLYMQ